MKKLILSICFAGLLASTSFAQFEDNKFLLGGSLSTVTSNAEGDRVFSQFEFSPAVGYVLNESSVAGIRTSFATSSTPTGLGTDDSFAYELGLFYRKYWSISEKIFLFGQGDANYLGGTNENQTDAGGTTVTETTTLSGLSIGITPGITARLTEWLLIDFSLGQLRYARQTVDFDSPTAEDSSTSLFTFSLNNPTLGFVFSF